MIGFRFLWCVRKPPNRFRFSRAFYSAGDNWYVRLWILNSISKRHSNQQPACAPIKTEHILYFFFRVLFYFIHFHCVSIYFFLWILCFSYFVLWKVLLDVKSNVKCTLHIKTNFTTKNIIIFFFFPFQVTNIEWKKKKKKKNTRKFDTSRHRKLISNSPNTKARKIKWKRIDWTENKIKRLQNCCWKITQNWN